jgi:hypothetical protein
MKLLMSGFSRRCLPHHPSLALLSCAGAARPVFPFTAIVGQEEMKLALILNVIDPKIGGVMVMGDRGTGKSTTIRALADLLPEMKVGAAGESVGLLGSQAFPTLSRQTLHHSPSPTPPPPLSPLPSPHVAAHVCIWAPFRTQRTPSTPASATSPVSNLFSTPPSCCMSVQVVAKDPFNSDPEDPELRSSEVRARLKAGESLPVGTMKIPMVRGGNWSPGGEMGSGGVWGTPLLFSPETEDLSTTPSGGPAFGSHRGPSVRHH